MKPYVSEIVIKMFCIICYMPGLINATQIYACKLGIVMLPKSFDPSLSNRVSYNLHNQVLKNSRSRRQATIRKLSNMLEED